MSPGVLLGAMSLGDLIDALDKLQPDLPLWVGSGRYRLAGAFSYRGYYEDLALGFTNDPPGSVRDGLSLLHMRVNSTIEGWKGGSYTDAVIGVKVNGGAVELLVDRIDS